MSGWAHRLISELDDADRRAVLLAQPFTREQLNWRPTPDAWSVGQCLEHLLAANKVYLPAISASLDGQPISPVQEITPGWFGRWFIRKYIAPSAETTRAKAPSKVRPGELADASIVESFTQSNRAAKELVWRAADYDVNRIRFRNPFVPLIRFTVGTGLEIIAKHQSRHLLQAERVRESPGFPRA